MMIKRIWLEDKRTIILICALFFLAHFTFVIVSGQWWDDWLLWNHSADQIESMYDQSGRPWAAFHTTGIMNLSFCGYKPIVFILYLFSSVLFFEAIKNIFPFSRNEAFWITSVALTAPVNDTRITLICYNNTVSFFLFMLAFFAIVLERNYIGRKRKTLRVISIVALFFSYSMLSLLSFTMLIWIFLFCSIRKENPDRDCLGIIRVLIKNYWDYILLPFGFWIFKTFFHHPHGNYEGEYNLTIQKILEGLINIPMGTIKTMIYIVGAYRSQLCIVFFSFMAGVFAYVLFGCIRRGRSVEDTSVRHSFIFWVKLLLFGCFVFSLALFPYYVYRGNVAIGNAGVGGRDTILTCFGIGITIVAISRLLPARREFQNLIPIIFIVLGIFHFSDAYLNYQEDWYRQLEFRNVIANSSEIQEDHTILCDFSEPSVIDARCFYVLNGNSFVETGKMDKFYFSEIRELRYGLDFPKGYLQGYNCDYYDSSDMDIDGILFMDFHFLSNIDIVKLRFKEVFFPEEFKKEIRSLSDYEYIRIDKSISDEIYKRYTEGTLTSDDLKNIV